MAYNANPAFDQFSVSLAEDFRTVVDDNVFSSNTVMQDAWPDAEKRDPGRWLAIPLLTAKNQNAVAFGQYDVVPGAASSVLSAATTPWSFYTCALNMSWQELRMIQGANERVDLVAVQLETAIASMNDAIGNDLCNFTPKWKSTLNGVNSLGIVEATDDGTLVNTYESIARTGTGSFANWQGNCIRKFALTGLGTGTNDPTPSIFYLGYTKATQGRQTPTDIYSTKDGIATYMYALQAQQRFAAGDVANPGFGGASLFGAILKADDHITNPVYNSNVGCNYYVINRNHTHFFYMGPKKGSEFIPWANNADGSIAQTCRYVIGLQYGSSQPRTGGQVLNVNSLANL